MAKLNVGIVGTGFIARTHVDAFRRACFLFPETETEVAIHIVADAELAQAERFAKSCGAALATADWHSVVDDPQIQLVDISAPNHLHFPIAMAAIEAGKAVYCEKPLALSHDQARQMSEAATQGGVQTFVAFNNLFAPSTQLAKILIDDGAIGRPVQFIGSFDQGFYSDPALPHSWRVTEAEAGSGALGDLGSHIISIAQHLVGPVSSVMAQDAVVFADRPVAVTGSGYGARSSSQAERRPVENDDFFEALVRFETGALGSIGASRVAPGKVFGINWEVRGTEGALRVDDERPSELQIFRMADAPHDRGFKTVLAGSQVEGFREGFLGFDYGGGGIGYFDVKVLEIRAMLLALVGKAENRFDFEFGRQNQAIVDAIRESARTAGTRLNPAV